MTTSAPGKLIVIDGTNAAGKATQTSMLVERMQREHIAVDTYSFPQYGKKSAGPVEEYLAGMYGTLADVGPYRGSIFYAIDRYAASADIRAKLNAGTHIVLNRYVSANMGHQGCQILDAQKRRDFFAWNDHLEYDIFGIPRPDLNIILHVPAAISEQLLVERGLPTDIQEKDVAHLRASEQTYLEIAQMFPDYQLVECVEADHLMSREAIHEKIWQIVQPIFVHEKIPV